jgi:hypothetical protein
MFPVYCPDAFGIAVRIIRYTQRNIKVINLRGKKSDYQAILNQFFLEVKEMIDEKSPSKITATNEKAREELKLPSSNKRLCFISAPYTRISFLKELIYPILNKNGITPITLDEAIMPGDNWMAKSETLLKESSFAIVDASGNNANVMWELGVIMSLKKNLIVIVEEEQYRAIPHNLSNLKCLLYSTNNDNQKFITQLNEGLSTLVQLSHLSNDNEPERLLRKNEYDAAVISSFRLLESTLREYDGVFFTKGSNRPMPIPLSQMLRYLIDSNLPQDLVRKAIDYVRIRNQIVHVATTNISKKTATDIVKTINTLVGIINNNGVKFNQNVVSEM